MLSRFQTATLVLGLAIGVGCGPQVGFNATTGIFPTTVQLGDTIAVAVDSNNVPLFDDLVEKHDLSLENTEINLEVYGDPACNQTLSPRSVFEAGLAKTTERTQFRGPSITIAMVDIPTTALPCIGSFPKDVVVRLIYDGAPDSSVGGVIEVTGDQGAPTRFRHNAEVPTLGPLESLDERFDPKPALRLRPLAGDGTSLDPGFDESWTIGSIEFDLEYADDKVTSPTAYTAADAVNGTAIVGPSTSLGGNRSVAHVVVMDPAGFQLGAQQYTDGAGEGPVVDVTFDKLLPFDVAQGDFAIENLVVTSLSGAIEVDLRDEVAPDGSAAFFNLIAIAND